jgi:chemotaxis protein MotB
MSRKHKGGDHGDIHADERWLVTYADMITLLLAVFIVMYALSDTNLRKFNAFAQSLSAAFNTDVLSGSSQFTVTEGQSNTADASAGPTSVGFVGTDAQTLATSLKNFAIQNGFETSVSVDTVPEGIAIRIKANLLFQAGRATLDPPSFSLLAEVAAVIKPLPQRVRIEGNTDSTPVSGPLFRDNFELSGARALAVLHYLVDQGVDPTRLAMAGNGDNNPLPGTQPADEANRRVEIFVLNPTTTTTPSPTPAIESIAPSFAPVFGG